MSAIGVILQLSYRLRRHLLLGWSLAHWLGLLLIVAVLGTLIRWWSYPWPAVALTGLFLAYVLILAWASRQGYVRFVALPKPGHVLEDASLPARLGTEELLPTRASGWFTVEGQDRYYVDIEADFETVGTREHIVLGRVHPSRFLLLGEWPKEEVGWWYIFFRPAMIRKVRLGHLHFGSRPHLALQVLYALDRDRHQTVHFTFGDTLALRRVWDDLLLDAPPGVTQEV